MAKILMVNLPYAGHTNPTLPLARQLVQNGHRVTYVNAPEWREKIEATGAAFMPYNDWPAAPTEQQKKTLCFAAAFKTAMAVGPGHDLLLYEMFFYPGKALAKRLGIPRVKQYSQPAWNQVVYHTTRKDAPMFHASCKLIDRQVMNRRTTREIGVDRGLIESNLCDNAPLHIVYVPEALQPMRETFDKRYLFVAAQEAMPSPPGAEKIPWGEMPRPVIYISMGSIMSSRVFCKRCIKAFGGKDVSVILATARIPPESLGALPSNIRALSVAPQVEILGRADLFITHCGMNSVNEAMAAGIPMLAMPVLNDQPLNAAQVVRLGVGHRIRGFPTTAAKLYNNAMAALADEALRENAKRVQQNLAQNPGISDAAKAVERLLARV